jgi:hypothetical protein
MPQTFVKRRSLGGLAREGYKFFTFSAVVLPRLGARFDSRRAKKVQR